MVNSIYYSPSTNSFYPVSLKHSYEASKSWPDDCVEVDYSVFKEFALNISPEGKIRAAIDGMPAWVIKERTDEEVFNKEDLWVKSELDKARDELDKVQDGDPLAIGSVADWRTYRKSLRQWLENRNFDESGRPVSPKDKE